MNDHADTGNLTDTLPFQKASDEVVYQTQTNTMKEELQKRCQEIKMDFH